MVGFFVGVLFIFQVYAEENSSAIDPVDKSRILQDFATTFISSYDDFINPRKQSLFFPLTKARAMNEKLGRYDNLNINSEEYANKITASLKTWRGFDEIGLDFAQPFLELLVTTLTDLGNQENVSLSSLDFEEIQKLPRGWQYLLPRHLSNEMTGYKCASLVNAAPGNTAMLFKMAIAMRDADLSKKQQFMGAISLPEKYLADLGYILGYRWGIAEEESASEDFKMSTLLHVPSDELMKINEATFESLNLSYKLEDRTKWHQANEQARVAWFTLFEKYEGWMDVGGTPYHVVKHGHLMSGAPMQRLRGLKKQKVIETSLLAEVLDKTPLDPIRAQEIWEALSKTDVEDNFASQAMQLDVSQIMAYFSNYPLSKPAIKDQLENLWSVGQVEDMPWVNLLALAFNYMDDEEFVSWNKEQLVSFGKFAAILSPAELDLLSSDNFDSSVMRAVLSPSMSLGQLSTLYDKFLGNNEPSSTPDPLLFSAIPSSALMSPSAPFIWSQDKTRLLSAGKLFTPAQTHALQELTKPGYWNSGNVSTILVTNPDCIADIHPQAMKQHLDQFIQGIYQAGPMKFHEIALNLQQLPRHLLMAWLEEVHERPGSKIMSKFWKSDVLLDRVTELSIPDGTVPNPDSSHPLASQFDRFTSANKSLLPSLALKGMSCHCINLVETQDTLEVLALFRFHLERNGGVVAMPSSSRKCWAKKVRKFLQLKSKLFNQTVKSEPELLSLLSTSDIKAIGGEVLATWGGPALASITHPEVMHEVLMTIGHSDPHLFIRNGVTYNCMKVMANALLDTMIKEEGVVNLRVLAHVHNLVPFSDGRILEASQEDIKLYITTVLKPICKAVCLKSTERDLVRRLILKAYGPSKSWTSLDLTEIGDLLIMMARSDLAAVQPTALRRASAQLSRSLWTTMLSDIRGYTREVLYHEACGAWLGGKEGRRGSEAIKFHNQWMMFGHFVVVGSFLQVEVLMNKVGLPKPRSNDKRFRRRRQAGADVDYKTIYTLVMNDMKAKFDAQELTNDQKTAATRIITETQKLLGDTSFAVLGLERGDKSQAEVLAVLAEYKDSGNMTQDQTNQVKKLAVDTQVRMIQELVDVLGLSASELGLTTEQLDFIMARHTFVLKPPGEPVGGVNTTELLNDADLPEIKPKVAPNGTELTSTNASQTAEPSSAFTVSTISSTLSSISSSISSTVSSSSLVSSTTLSSTSQSESSTVSTSSSTSQSESSTVSTSLFSISSISTRSTSVATSSSFQSTSGSTAFSPLFTSVSATSARSTTRLNTVSSVSSISSTTDALSEVLNEENDIEGLLNLLSTFKYYEPSSEYFSAIPSLDDVAITCDVLIASGSVASSLSSTQLSSMTLKEVENCLEIIGHIPWSQSALQSVWEVVKTKVPKLKMASMLPIKRQEMILLKNLLPAVATIDPSLLDMRSSNIDGISYLGSLLDSADPMVLNLVQLYITLNEVTVLRPFTAVEAASLGQLLCGLRDEQWKDLITEDVFASILTGHLSLVECSVNNTTAMHLASMLINLYGPTNTWTSSDLLSTGWLASVLSPLQLSLINPHAMEGLTGQAVKFLSREQIQALDHKQVVMMSPHAASFISKDQLMPHVNMHLRRGIRAAGGEDEKLVATMEKIEPEMQVIDMEVTTTTEDPESKPVVGGGCTQSSSRYVIGMALVFIIVSVM